MRNIVDEAGEIIAKATDDHTLIGGHHRLAVAASLGQKLFWKHTGEPVRLDPFFKGSSHRHTVLIDIHLMRRQRDATARASGRTVEIWTGDARAGQGGLLLIGADADPEVGHHDGETDHHGDDQHILGSVTHP